MIKQLTGTVIHGKGIGHRHGMPTANIIVKDSDLPELGVYGGLCRVSGQEHLCITNVGNRPSIDNDPSIIIETLIFDFDEDIYGQTIEVDLLWYLRPIQKFNGIEEVKQQIDKDIEHTKALYKQKAHL